MNVQTVMNVAERWRVGRVLQESGKMEENWKKVERGRNVPRIWREKGIWRLGGILEKSVEGVEFSQNVERGRDFCRKREREGVVFQEHKERN